MNIEVAIIYREIVPRIAEWRDEDGLLGRHFYCVFRTTLSNASAVRLTLWEFKPACIDQRGPLEIYKTHHGNPAIACHVDGVLFSKLQYLLFCQACEAEHPNLISDMLPSARRAHLLKHST